MRPWTNLLTQQDAYRDALRQILRRYGLPWAVLFAVIVALLAIDAYHLRQAAQHRDRWLDGAKEVEQLKERIASVHAERAALEAKIRAANRIGRGLPPAWVLALAVKAVGTTDQSVVLTEIQLVEEEQQGYRIQLRGRARDHRAMAKFIHSLEGAGINAVQILSLRAADDGDEPMEFDVQVELERASHE